MDAAKVTPSEGEWAVQSRMNLFSVTTGALLGLKGLVAALVVGFSEPIRAFGAGLVLGVVEAAIASGEISGHGIGPAYREVLPLAFALLLLAARTRREAPEPE